MGVGALVIAFDIYAKILYMFLVSLGDRLGGYPSSPFWPLDPWSGFRLTAILQKCTFEVSEYQFPLGSMMLVFIGTKRRKFRNAIETMVAGNSDVKDHQHSS